MILHTSTQAHTHTHTNKHTHTHTHTHTHIHTHTHTHTHIHTHTHKKSIPLHVLVTGDIEDLKRLAMLLQMMVEPAARSGKQK